MLSRINFMLPDPQRILEAISLDRPLIGFYDTPDPAPFEPLMDPPQMGRACIFAFNPAWNEGRTLHLTRDAFGCGGAGRWLCGVETRSREDFIGPSLSACWKSGARRLGTDAPEGMREADREGRVPGRRVALWKPFAGVERVRFWRPPVPLRRAVWHASGGPPPIMPSTGRHSRSPSACGGGASS